MSDNIERYVAVAGIAAATVAGAALFRLRGSSFFYELVGRGASTARVVAWSLPMAMISLGGVPSYVNLAAVALCFWLGAIAPWWQSISLGRVPEEKEQVLPAFAARMLPSLAAFLVQESWRRDAALHALRGMIWVIPPALAIGWFGGDWRWMMLSGAMCVPSYEIGWRLSRKHATEIGELLFGASIGAAAALS